MKNIFISLFIIISLTYCAKPPTIEKIKQIIPDTPSVVKKDKNTNLSFKRLSSTPTKIENSKLTVNFEDNYQTLEHQLTIVPENLQNGYYISGWSFSTDSEGIELSDISNTCELVDASNGKSTKKDCMAQIEKNGNTIKLSYECEIYNTDKLIITYKYKKTKKSKQILFKAEPIIIPIINDSINCDYKFKIPKGYINLGLQNNILKKESDIVYSFNGKCPSEETYEIIRYSPEEVTWDADIQLTLQSSEVLSNEINLVFPRYYKGGKLKNDKYTITDTNNGNYDENNIIDKDDQTKYNIIIPAPNNNNLGVELRTSFTNKLTNQFNVYLPEKYYNIDLTKIPQKIQDKAKEVIKEKSDFPNYYKLGKFVDSYMTYDISYTGKKMTLEEIYEGKIGVWDHYTLLYNAMLNSIGIKTLFIVGWAFDQDQTSGNNFTVGHAWTAALIDNKWKELDVTWDLLEGISAGHIYKNFGVDAYSYKTQTSQDTEMHFENNPSIKMNKIIQSFKDDEKGEKTDDIKVKIDEINEKTDDIKEKTDDIKEKTSNIKEKIDDIKEKTNDIKEKTNDIMEKADDIKEKTNDIKEKTDEKKTDTYVAQKPDENDDDIPIIRRSEGYCLKSSLLLLGIFFLF